MMNAAEWVQPITASCSVNFWNATIDLDDSSASNDGMIPMVIPIVIPIMIPNDYFLTTIHLPALAFPSLIKWPESVIDLTRLLIVARGMCVISEIILIETEDLSSVMVTTPLWSCMKIIQDGVVDYIVICIPT